MRGDLGSSSLAPADRKPGGPDGPGGLGLRWVEGALRGRLRGRSQAAWEEYPSHGSASLSRVGRPEGLGSRGRPGWEGLPKARSRSGSEGRATLEPKPKFIPMALHFPTIWRSNKKLLQAGRGRSSSRKRYDN